MSDPAFLSPGHLEIPDAEFEECTTKRRKWWVIRFENGEYYGEETDNEGFDLALFNSKKAGEEEATRVFEDDDWPPYEVVEICWSIVGHTPEKT